MHQSKLIQLLKSLEDDEFKQFSKFVRSPIYNTNPTIVKLYEILKTTYPNFNSPRLKKEKVYQKLYSGQPFQYHPMANLMSAMLKMTEEYLVFLENQQDPFQKKKVLTKAYGRRNMYLFFEKGTGQLIKQLEKSEIHDSDYYFEMMSVKGAYFHHPKTNKLNVKDNQSINILEMLDRFYVLNKIKIGSELKTIKKSIATTYENNLMQTAIELAEKTYSTDNPLFYIYSQINNLHDEKSDQLVYYKIKNKFIKIKDKLSYPDLKSILYELINYSIRRINKGDIIFNNEALNLFKLGLEHEVLIENGKITESTFGNIVSSASYLKEFEWAKEFIYKYGIYLDEKVQNSIKAISLGEVEFSQNNFDNVIQLLNNEIFVNIIHQLKVKFRLITVWYEKSKVDDSFFDFTLYQIEAFTKYLTRNKSLSNQTKNGFQNFLKTVKHLILNKFKLKNDENKKNELIIKVNTYDQIIGKTWLLSKINEI